MGKVRQASRFISRSRLLCLSVVLLTQTVSISLADYEFTVHFREFRNPLGLQCGACGSGRPPACCDDVQRQGNCVKVPPRTCDTRFRFILRQFEESLATAPTTGFPYFTSSNGGNNVTFGEGPGGFLGIPNPFTINRTNAWTGKIQFLVDALDRAVPLSGLSETEVFINRFPINLQLRPGPNFTDRVNYTGIYDISGLLFDISFRVQCLENYYGSNCTTFCAPLQGIYTCDSEGSVVCIQTNRDPATNCSTVISTSDGMNVTAMGWKIGRYAFFLVIMFMLCN